MNKTSRVSETREKQVRGHDNYVPASMLPVPEPRPGVRFRWVRVSTLGETDAKNVSSRFRENWTPVNASDHPEIAIIPDPNSRFKDHIEVGGLVLCANSAENVERRRSYYEDRSREQIQSVDNAFLRNNDPRMPLHLQRNSRTTFGSGMPNVTVEESTE